MAMHSLDCIKSAFYQYALGYSLDHVRKDFAEAAGARLKVFELRGTEETFPVVILTVDPSKSEDDPAFVIGDRLLDPPGTRDYSLTNSRWCLQGMFCAWINGEESIANQLAKLMWDPPNASYIGPDSETCTTNQMHLAYAVKHLLLENPEEARRELAHIGYRPRSPDPEMPYLAKMVRGLVENHYGNFTDGLQELLHWHRKQVNQPWNKTNPKMYFCMPAVALCILAMGRGLVQKTELPEDPYLPLELIPEN